MLCELSVLQKIKTFKITILKITTQTTWTTQKRSLHGLIRLKYFLDGIRSCTVLTVSYFVVVASILGTGILALPVKVGETGFYPFLIQFAICAVFQCLVLLFMIELLQKAATHQVRFRYLAN
jgi:ABC-type proline/glycine betaine transport system permease subunit